MTQDQLKKLKRRLVDFIHKTEDHELILVLAKMCKIKLD